MAISVNQKVTYLGIKYVVTEVTDVYVKLMRENRGSVELSVAVGSNRFYSLFPNEAKSKKPTFNIETQPETEVIETLPIYDADGDVAVDEDGVVCKFIWDTCIDDYNPDRTSSECEAYMREALSKDKTGVIRFIMTSWANANNAFKFNTHQVLNTLRHYNKKDRPVNYSNVLLEYYKACLQDDSPATQEEINRLISLLPQKDGTELLLCFCGFDWKAHNAEKCAVKPKKILEILKEIPENSEELNDEGDDFEDFDD